MEYTKGPWRVGPESTILVGEGSWIYTIAQAFPLYGKENGHNHRENACLMASAPDLLEACNWALSKLFECRAETSAIIAKLKNTIAKAEGRN